MGELATKNMLEAGRQDKLAMLNTTNKQSMKNSSSSAIPDHVQIYVQDHQINQVIKTAINKVLREQPADPFSSMAAIFLASSKKSYPVFQKFEARRIFLENNSKYQTFQISVYMSYKGRS